MTTCPRCLKQTDGIHTCTPTKAWRELEQKRDDLAKLCEFNEHTMADLLKQRDDLLDLVALSIPYIEEAEKDPAYKPGSVAKLTARMRAAVEGGAV